MSLGDLTDTQCQNGTSHRLPVLVFVQLSLKVQLEINELRRTECNNDLSFVCGGSNDRLPLRNSPLVNPAAGGDVSDTMGVDLKKGIRSDLLHSDSRRGRQESCVLHFFDSFSYGKDEGAVDE